MLHAPHVGITPRTVLEAMVLLGNEEKRTAEAGAHLSERAWCIAPSRVPKKHYGRGNYSLTCKAMKLQDGSLKHFIYSYLRAHPGVKINGGEIEKLAQAHGHKAENGDRRARELANAGRALMREGKQGGFVLSEVIPGKTVSSIWYWYVPSVYEVIHQQRQQEGLFAS